MSHFTLSVIAAVPRNGALGKGNQLLWREPEDLKHFRRVTMGSLVITRNATWCADGAEAVASIEAALALLAGATKAFVIGGAEIYALALPLANELVLTEIDADLAGDVFFPAWDRTRFTCLARESRDGFSFVTYKKTGGD